ncbi:Wzz/FepE/Etk N-terminal domain-containing protein [Bacteroidota bacterium]
MENNLKEKYTFHSLDLLSYIIKKWKVLAIITAIAAIGSIIVSLVITPKYESTIIFFPTTTSSVSKALISNNVFLNKDVLMFGDEEDAEQMIQVLYSDEIKNKLIEKYDLMSHYGIDPNSKIKWTILDRKMKENINFTKTKYMSIEVSVMDEDPVTAKNIAEDIGNFLDTTINRMRQDMALKAFRIVEKEYLTLQKEISEIEDSLKYISNLGLYDFESQSQALNEAYVKATAESKTELAKKIKKELNVLSEYGATYQSLTKFLEHENERLSLLKAKYMEAKVDAENQLPHKFIVTNAFVPEIKAYPPRSIIVVVSTLSAFLMGLMMLLLIDFIRRLKENKII